MLTVCERLICMAGSAMSFSVTNMSKRTPPPQDAGIAKNRGIPGPRQEEKCVALVPQALTRALEFGLPRPRRFDALPFRLYSHKITPVILRITSMNRVIADTGLDIGRKDEIRSAGHTSGRGRRRRFGWLL
jgi:hypothetical protein